MDKKIVEYQVHANETDYIFWAGPSGRRITARLRKYKRHIVFLYCCVGVLMAAAGTLAYYFCKLINGGYGV